MKDREARFDIGVEKITRQKLEQRHLILEEKLNILTKAYDALFDVVAKDLGYQPKIDPHYTGLGITWAKLSPRQFEMTTPPAPQLVRTITAIGKKVTK